ncbi:BBT_HP_G0131710.mRNA.1.CDS.1 [Saccharomyces cerevisiae]|nr:BBT_HP_G0131710.mRNA.1.CDS.1 [Saccharomyces cerevisiae]CAI6975384.1 BBT_HP_G0131710.mRNA.1.CDS.1 [Saccharomyces cerevisiae]
MSTHDRRRKLNSAIPVCPPEICFDQYTLDSLSDHNMRSISIFRCWISERLGFADISLILCKRTIHTFWRLYDRSTGQHH